MYFDNNEANGEYEERNGHDIYLRALYCCLFSLEQGPYNKDTGRTNTPSDDSRAEFYAVLEAEKADANWLGAGDKIPPPGDVYVHCESEKSEGCGEEKVITIGTQFTQANLIKGDEGSSVSLLFQEMSGEAWIKVEDSHALFFSSLNISLVQSNGKKEFTASLFSLGQFS